MMTRTGIAATGGPPRVALILWALALVGGFSGLAAYDTRPGRSGDAPDAWPADAPFARRDGAAALVLFVHPRCPCTRATLEELDRILARARGARFDAHVLVYAPDGGDPSFCDTDIVERARRLPGVKVHLDREGEWARRFGALVSGYALAYGRDGTLRFRGGITASRGHAGSNRGSEAVLAVLTGRAGASDNAVFGCDLFGEESEE